MKPSDAGLGQNRRPPWGTAEEDLQDQLIAHTRAIVPDTDTLGLMYCMVAGMASAHEAVNNGSVVYDEQNKVFFGPAYNDIRRDVVTRHSYMLEGPHDKEYTDCGEINAIRAAGGVDYLSRERAHQTTIFTWRLCCTRCRPVVRESKPRQLIVCRETMDALWNERPDKHDEFCETWQFFEEAQIKIRAVSLPWSSLMAKLMERLNEYPFGVPVKRTSRDRWQGGANPERNPFYRGDRDTNT